jgi:hypothetical protein
MVRAEKSGAGQCECPCGMQLPVVAVNGQGQSVWHLDHDPRTKTFRAILFERCNREIGDGDRSRKFGHAEYVLAHEARLAQIADVMQTENEFLREVD